MLAQLEDSGIGPAAGFALRERDFVQGKGCPVSSQEHRGNLGKRKPQPELPRAQDLLLEAGGGQTISQVPLLLLLSVQGSIKHKEWHL